MLSETQNDLILAKLALQLGKPHGHTIGENPSNEELAALADNRVTAVRRAQIMSHIANDAATYQRWLAVVQAVADYSDHSAAKSHRIQAKNLKPAARTGLLGGLTSLFFGSTLRAGVFGGGFATAAALLAVVLLLPSLDDVTRINDVYDQWSPGIRAQWDSSTHNPKISIGASRAFRFRSEAEHILAYGYNSGAKSLGLPKYETLGIQLERDLGQQPSRPDDLSTHHYKSLLSLGRLAALTTLQCDLANVSQDFSSIYKTARHLSRQLSDISDNKISALVADFPQQIENQEKESVCVFTDKVIINLFSDS